MINLCRRGADKQPKEWRRYAKPSEITSYFCEHHDSLLWIVLAITGREHLAEAAISAVSDGATHGRAVFLDWIGPWAEYELARSAIALIKHDISCAALQNDGPPYEIEEPEGLSEIEIRALRRIDPLAISAALDPLARSVLILHTLHNTTTYDCAVALDVSSVAVFAARCRALRWLRATQILEGEHVSISAAQHR